MTLAFDGRSPVAEAKRPEVKVIFSESPSYPALSQPPISGWPNASQ